jgi:Methyltransferase domain
MQGRLHARRSIEKPRHPVTKNCEVRMPVDWNDRAGWDEYYASRLARPKRDPWDDATGSIRIADLLLLAEDLKSRGSRAVWVPGCGLSPLARLLAHLGWQVIATDVSPVAVEFQRNKPDEFAHLTTHLGPVDSSGSFAAEVHDFRTEFRREAFDLILNVKALQAFPAPDMERIAGVHAAALRKGRYAYFDTMNVQGERRNQLEQALEDGGFVVPYLALNKSYRKALQDTGIPHGFIMGQPMIVRTGEYAGGGPKWDRDMARLREISAEYQRRLEAEQWAEQRRIGPDSKVAHVIYSTG